MAISRIKNWVALEVLTAADLNAEFSNILNNALSLVSPWTANMAAGGFRLTGLHAGTVGDPSLQFTSDVNTGIFSSAADTVDVAVGGVRGLQVTGVASAVNYLDVAPSATGNPVTMTAEGTDTNVGIDLDPKGTGTVRILGTATGTLGGVIDRDVSTADVVNTATETTVYTFSVPANTMSTNRALRLVLIGDYLNNSAGAQVFTVKVKFGATTIHSDNQNTPATNAVRRPVSLDVILSANNATGAQVCKALLRVGGTQGMGFGGLTTQTDGVHNAIAEDSTTAKTLEVTFQHGAADANISARALAVQVELL